MPRVTLPETNDLAPENNPLETEIPIGNHHFQGVMLVFGSVSVTKHKSLAFLPGHCFSTTWFLLFPTSPPRTAPRCFAARPAVGQCWANHTGPHRRPARRVPQVGQFPSVGSGWPQISKS